MGTLTHHFKYTVAALYVFVASASVATAADLDALFAQLQQAEPAEQSRIASQIVAEWEKSGSPAMDLLLRRGKDALDAGDAEAAIDHFSALIDHAPDFSEAYNGRATAYFLLGMTGQALDDLRILLIQSPRHFGGMRGVAVILEDLGRHAQALDAYRAVLDIYPAIEGVSEAVARLKLELEGQTL